MMRILLSCALPWLVGAECHGTNDNTCPEEFDASAMLQAKIQTPTPSDKLSALMAKMEEREKFFEEAIKNHSLSALDIGAHAEFEKFLRNNVRHYFQKMNVSEYVQRLKNFKKSILTAGVRNAIEKAKNTHKRRAVHGITKFADWHDHEFHALTQGGEKKPAENYTCAFVAEQYGCSLELEVLTMAQVCPQECSGTSSPSLVSIASHHSRRRKDHSSRRRRRRRRDPPAPPPPPPPSPPPPSPPPSPPSHSQPDIGSCKNWGSKLEVRDQGHCGDCWAFSAVETIRGTYIAEHGEDPGKLSTQFLVDCMKKGEVCWTTEDGKRKHGFIEPGQQSYDGLKVSELHKNGCCGGNADAAMDFVMQQGGIPTQAEYGDVHNDSLAHGITFSGIDPATSYPCKSGIRKAVTVTGGHVKLDSEDIMASHVCDAGPVSVGVSTHGWGTYKGGVLSAATCGSTAGHDVIVVGLNKGDNAWIVQNSWGSDFGVALDGGTLSSSNAGKNFLHGKYCSHLVEQGCSLTVEDAIDAISKTMQFEIKGNWKKSGKTVADECQKSCAAVGEKGGYIYMEFGKNTCAITPGYVPKSTAKA